MDQLTAQLIVRTIVKTTVCDGCKGLRLSIQGKPHCCSQKKGRRAGGGQVIVLAKHKSVLVTST
jgi:hypothetical protein